MIPIRLEIHNFLPYRAPDAILFEGIHLACLTGANGAGKSSLLDAMTWVLWGKARAKRDDELVHLGQQDMQVQLDFEQEGVLYRVLRRRSRSGRGKGTLDLFAHDGEQFHLISEPAMRQTQQKINTLLRLDYETFINSAFLQQGRADAFTTKTPAERKAILSDILGLDRWALYEEAAKTHQREIENELSVIELRLQEIEDELAKEPALRDAVEEARVAQQEAHAALEAAEKHLEEVAHATTEMKNTQERLAVQERRLKEHRDDVEAVDAEIENQEKRIDEYEAILAARDDIEAGYAALQAAREADHELGDKLRQLRDFDTQYNEAVRQLDAARAELESEMSRLEATIAADERIIAQVNQADLDDVRVQIGHLELQQAERDTLQDRLNQLAEDRAAIDAHQKTLSDEGKNLNERLANLEDVADALCPLCGQPLDDDHRQQLIAQLTAERDAHRETYRNNQQHLQEIAEQSERYRQQIDAHDKALKQLNMLRKREGELQSQHEQAQEAQARIDAAMAQLDAVREMLEAETFAGEIRQQLAELDAKRHEIGYDRETHDATREQLDAYRDYDARQQQLELAAQSLPDAQASRDNALKRRERILKSIVEDEQEITRLQAEIERLGVLVEEQQRRQEEVNRLRTDERVAHERLIVAQQELDAIETQRERKAELTQRAQAKRHEKAIYDELRLAFGKKGVPAMIIEAAIPELETAATHLLQRMTDGRMSLKLETQREKASGDGVMETLDIQIADELGTRNYELYSGGEAFRINFALRVALSQMLARRAGAHLRTLFIDEGFGTQDEDGRNHLVEAIIAIQDDFDLILVITHIEELRDSFPVHLIVEKTPSGSRVSMR